MKQVNKDANLRDLRIASGLPLVTVYRALREKVPQGPRFPSGICNIEKRGTDSNSIIKALHEIYGFPLDVVEAAARRKCIPYVKSGRNRITTLEISS